ncbi:MAG: PIN domain-containing protein [Acidobacteriia bacterium]|nr:PIN domain-containing protein [Terriglobia bacterium]
MKAIVDTSFIVAFSNRNDQFHRWAVDLARELDAPFLTCESVLSEAAFHLTSSEAVLDLVATGMLKIAFESSRHIEELRALASRYSDRDSDLADLCLIRMSELYPHHFVVTVDEEDFRVYRRNKRETIPLLCPPRK